MEVDEHLYPMNVNFFGSQAITPKPKFLANVVKKWAAFHHTSLWITKDN